MWPSEESARSERSQAIHDAIDVFQAPSRVRAMRAKPIAADANQALRVVAGEEDAIEAAMRQTGRSRRVVEDAASFYIEQILAYPDADNFRVLGANPNAAQADLRRNMALLVKWLHPDLGRPRARDALAARVTRAWEDLKTAERRQAYEVRLLSSAAPWRQTSRKRTLKGLSQVRVSYAPQSTARLLAALLRRK